MLCVPPAGRGQAPARQAARFASGPAHRGQHGGEFSAPLGPGGFLDYAAALSLGAPAVLGRALRPHPLPAISEKNETRLARVALTGRLFYWIFAVD